MQGQGQGEYLKILGAVYGLANITKRVRGMIYQNALQIRADPQFFGESAYGNPKSLVIVYQYGNYKPCVAILKDHDSIFISPSNMNQEYWNPPQGLKLCAAVYGLQDITEPVGLKLSMNNEPIDFTVSDSLFGDGWPGVRKTLVVVYLDEYYFPIVKVWEEGQHVKIGGAELKILGASYGKTDVTRQVRKLMINDTVKLAVNNNVFQDSLPGPKTLVVVYQHGNNKPEIAIAKEGENLEISPKFYQPQQWSFSNGQMRVLGAVFGTKVVTDILAPQVNNNYLNFHVNPQALGGDNWPGVQKTLTVVYLDVHGTPVTKTYLENEQIKLNGYQLNILGASYGKANITDKVRSLVSEAKLNFKVDNAVFGDSLPGRQKSLTIVYQYGYSKPDVVIVKEGDIVNISPSGHNQQPWSGVLPGRIGVLGASFGLGNVTANVAAKIQNESINLWCNTQTFGETWANTFKTFTLVYLDVNQCPQTLVYEENQQVNVVGQQQQAKFY